MGTIVSNSSEKTNSLLFSASLHRWLLSCAGTDYYSPRSALSGFFIISCGLCVFSLQKEAERAGSDEFDQHVA